VSCMMVRMRGCTGFDRAASTGSLTLRRIGGVLLVLALGALTARAADDADDPRETERQGCALVPGVYSHTLEVDGKTRRYTVSVGPIAPESAHPPVILLWHGFGSTGGWMLDALDPGRDWPEGIAVAAEGLPRRLERAGRDRKRGWQVQADELGDRDLHLFDALIPALQARYCIDPAHVYSAGLSNGAYFSNLLGCQRGAALAGIAPTAGGGPFPASCSAPVAVHITHGRRDAVVNFAEAGRSLRTWAKVNGCSEPESIPELDCVALEGCARATELCAHRGEHEWPGSATAAIVEFVRAREHELRSSVPSPSAAPSPR
jgi:polyhydroxybutyrate depolymerase